MMWRHGQDRLGTIVDRIGRRQNMPKSLISLWLEWFRLVLVVVRANMRLVKAQVSSVLVRVLPNRLRLRVPILIRLILRVALIRTLGVC
jgi:hypothetical protein